MRVPKFIFKYLFYGTFFRIFKGAKHDIDKEVRIINSKIVISSGASIKIGRGVSIKNAKIFVEKGELLIDDNCIIGGVTNETVIIINNGYVSLGHHSKLACEKVWIRFGGKLEIGHYTNINKGSEIRCDESILIGSYSRISYNVKIWDTNTHNILEKVARREVTERFFPYFGHEDNRPITKPVVIGDDCWIGENAAILKGTTLGEGSIVGFNTILTGKVISHNCTVVQDVKLKIIENRI